MPAIYKQVSSRPKGARYNYTNKFHTGPSLRHTCVSRSHLPGVLRGICTGGALRCCECELVRLTRDCARGRESPCGGGGGGATSFDSVRGERVIVKVQEFNEYQFDTLRQIMTSRTCCFLITYCSLDSPKADCNAKVETINLRMT